MKLRFTYFRRASGLYYARDIETNRKQSLGTRDLAEAQQLVSAMNQADAQPALNRAMAKVYLSAASPELMQRTWADVVHRYVTNGVESTRDRKERCFKSRPFASLLHRRLIDTLAENLFAVLEHPKAGNSVHHYLRRLHNHALDLGWLLAPVMAEAAWPKLCSKPFTAITEDEHTRIVTTELNLERKLYYQMLWETGGSQSDIANLSTDNIDREAETLCFQRQKLKGRAGGMSLLKIGPRIRALLDQLPPVGFLFPKIRLEHSKHRTSEFRRRCLVAKIKGRTLHSYRYAWAQRARSAGMPEREAMNHLGHKSRAIHMAYASAGSTTVLPLEHYEQEKASKLLIFKAS